MHWCLNVATGPVGRASAVLIRAGEVIEGAPLARDRRNGARDRDLARGPARLTQALGVTGEQNGVAVRAFTVTDALAGVDVDDSDLHVQLSVLVPKSVVVLTEFYITCNKRCGLPPF